MIPGDRALQAKAQAAAGELERPVRCSRHAGAERHGKGAQHGGVRQDGCCRSRRSAPDDVE